MASSVLNANEIIFQVFETACLSLREPSFYLPDWSPSIELFSGVVVERLERCAFLKKILKLNDDQVYETVWSNTLQLANQIEKTGLKEGFERLQLKNPMGILTSISQKLKYQAPWTFKFIDNLAKERDTLWKEFRQTQHPAVTVLPSCFPRGLPIQCFNGVINVAVATAHNLTPFIMSRAKALVFADTLTALDAVPEDKDMRAAIGRFIDGFSLALQIFVSQSSLLTDQKLRASQAWMHSLNNLSSRMTPDEALRIWRDVFQRALPWFEISHPDEEVNMEYPLFPYNAIVGLYTDWNPADGFNAPPKVDSRKVEPLTNLDCSLSMPAEWNPRLAAPFQETYLITKGYQPPSLKLWNMERISRKQITIPALREGLIMSALLFLQDKIPRHSNILAKPFPTLNDVRYPDIWLDLSFPDSDIHKAEAVLQRLLPSVAPSLLFKFTQSAFSALLNASAQDPKSTDLERLAFNMLKLLADSDRPYLANGLILNVIMEKPESSSWHRQLLNLRYLRRLSAHQATDIMQSFASAIQNKMVQQASFSKQPQTGETNTSATKTFVKVTTIKYLAQLLGGADFVPASFAVDILGELLKVSTHIDIRVAIMESLMTMLENCSNDTSPLGDQILHNMETTIPIIGGLDERRQLKETDWIEAEKTGQLPAVHEQDCSPYRNTPPILAAVLVSGSRLKPKWKKKVLEQLILPALELSIKNNNRWLALFTKQHNIELQGSGLPIFPIAPMVLNLLIVNYQRLLPAWVLALYQKLILTKTSSPPILESINEKLRDPRYRDLPDSKHWLSHYSNGTRIYEEDRFLQIDILKSPWVESERSDGIRLEQIQLNVLEQARCLISSSQ